MPRKEAPRTRSSAERAERNRERAEEGALAMAEYHAAAEAAIARIPKLRRQRLAKAARQAKAETRGQPA